MAADKKIITLTEAEAKAKEFADAAIDRLMQIEANNLHIFFENQSERTYALGRVEHLRENSDFREELEASFLAWLAKSCVVSYPSKSDATSHAFYITQLQKEILILIATGLSSLAVAEKLNISPRTVSRNVATIQKKLSASNQTDTVVRAIQFRLISLEEINSQISR